MADNFLRKPSSPIAKELMKDIMMVPKDAPEVELLSKAQNIIVSNLFDSTVYLDKPYLVTTQNQRYLENVLSKEAEKACVILGAGDTIFELARRDVKDITAVEINDMQILVFLLRKASLLTLSNNEFESFLIDINDKHFLSSDVFDYVKDGFSKEDEIYKMFWERFLTLNPVEDISTYFVKGGFERLPIDKVRYALPYMKKRGIYLKTREMIEKINLKIHHGDVFEYLLSNPEQKFDYIDLTNVLLFIYQSKCDSNPELFKEYLNKLKKIYEDNLNSKGTFTMDYMFGADLKDIKMPLVSDIKNEDDFILNIYRQSYEELSKLFELETFSIGNIGNVTSLSKPVDTVLLTKKR